MDKDTLRELSLDIEKIIGQYYNGEGGVTKFDGLTFLLADLMHYCDFQGIRYNAVVNAAKWHYQHNNFKNG
jgi:hypothetical protein